MKLSSGQHDLCLLSLQDLNVSCGSHKRECQRALDLFLRLCAVAEAMLCRGNAQYTLTCLRVTHLVEDLK